MKIKEIFWSFQGEGLRIGIPTVFIRLAGCSVKCPYCDSMNTWKMDTGDQKDLNAREVFKRIEDIIKKYPCSQITITGGEPLEQDLSDLTGILKRRNLFLSVETNGLHYQELPLDWWTVSPKDVTDYFIHPEILGKTNEIKLVVNSNLSIKIIKKISQKVPGTPIFLQPNSAEKDPYGPVFLLFQRCQEKGIPNIRCGVQLHKIYSVL